jgi:3-hydroxy acid dehydrogenase/malonic semialdehyde reductase
MSTYAPKTVLITGATAGFGAAVARRFAADGAKLILTGRRTERLAAMKAELKVPVHTIAVDVRDRAAVEASFKALPHEFADIDLLLNNAGLAQGLDKAQDANLDDWEVMIDTNIKGVLHYTHAVLPGMVARKRGHVINLGSTAGAYAYPGGNVYGATKAFIRNFSLNLRADLHGAGVRVTDIAPGLAETEFSMVRFKGEAEKASKMYSDTVPLTADDIAESIHWVATLPAHMNVNFMEIMPTVQSFQALAVIREPK